MVKNGGPDLKQARRTGLSAQRARRTKSRGLKNLQLEVGACRAPRLLVAYIVYIYFKRCGMVVGLYFPRVALAWHQLPRHHIVYIVYSSSVVGWSTGC